MQTIRVLVTMLALGLALSACATRTFTVGDNLRRGEGQPRILVMPPDVELSELSAAGVPELNALWTQQGRTNLAEAVGEHLRHHRAIFVKYVPPAEDTPDYQVFDQLQKLHGAVGETIRDHHVVRGTRLPTKKGKFDWSLGPAATSLGSFGDADYALFIHVRDSYSSPGRKAVQVVAGVLLGIVVEGGIQNGHASLVDLKTGKVVWYNFLHRDTGDLRADAPAKRSVAMLLNKLPK
jgi:hypothetical protein